MSYQALARTWRPGTFAELVGQEHVVKALVHALDDDRLHHAYLFTGTRGVGKTTIARIFAKSLNCEKGVSSVPCGECSSCLEIDQGRFVDLLEVDAASRTKVEDTRDLLDNVQYAPSRGRYKVYLIDEVHMLSGHSFNALLKTLEEPPPHVKFLLATTDPQKLPATVLSRCLQFNLKRLPVNLIQDRLTLVTREEKMESEAAALNQIARAADGSVRDALSLLDQAAAYCEGTITDSEVRTMLGTIDGEHAAKLLEALAAGSPEAVLTEVALLDERAPDYIAVLDELAALVQRVAVTQLAGAVCDDLPDEEVVRNLAENVSSEDLQLFYQIAIIGKRDLHLAPSMRTGFEMILLRMLTFRPAGIVAPGSANSVPRGDTGVGGDGPVRTAQAKKTVAATPPEKAARRQKEETDSQPATSNKRGDWNELIEKMKISGAARQLANQCDMDRCDGSSVVLTLDEQQTHMNTGTVQEKLRAALTKHFGQEVALKIRVGRPSAETPARQVDRKQTERQVQAVESIQTDANVLAMKEAFDAQVESESIKPLDN
jgi:DNA polymerase-3 subunit gamma/tau